MTVPVKRAPRKLSNETTDGIVLVSERTLTTGKVAGGLSISRMSLSLDLICPNV
jgi:hypothetical protein